MEQLSVTNSNDREQQYEAIYLYMEFSGRFFYADIVYCLASFTSLLHIIFYHHRF